jgi:hypothetical protein
LAALPAHSARGRARASPCDGGGCCARARRILQMHPAHLSAAWRGVAFTSRQSEGAEAPRANGGVIYGQHAHTDGPVTWVFSEMEKRTRERHGGWHRSVAFLQSVSQ